MPVALAAAATLVALAALPAQPASAEPGRQAPFTDKSVTMTVLAMSPSVPSNDKTHDLTITITLDNTTDQSLSTVTINATRGVPIETERALNSAIAHPEIPDPTLSQEIRPLDSKPVTTSLPAHGSATVTYATDTGIPTESGLCICANAIYPIYLTAHTTDLAGNDITVGTTQTYLPVFDEPDKVQPAQVSWVWPVLDRPHRLVDDEVAGQPPVFIDDDLAQSIQSGRLSRVLQVLDAVSGHLPITVVVDPELIDELAVMAKGSYVVRVNGHNSPGVGTAQAQDWLSRLRADIGRSAVDISYTPFADPDVEGLTRNGLSWTETLATTAQQRVADALGNPAHVDHLSWPVGEQLSADTLDALVRGGTSTVVLNDTALPSTQQSPIPNGIADLQTAAGSVAALVSSADVQRYVSPVVSSGAVGQHGFGLLPQLVSEVAVRAIENQQSGAYLPIVPPRFVDPDPDVTIRAMFDTERGVWTRGLTVSQAVATISPSNRGQLVPPPIGTSGLSTVIVDAAQTLTRVIPALGTMLDPGDAKTLLGSLPSAVQRAESAGWRTDPDGAAAFAAALTSRIDTLESGVQIIQPSTGTYTLASSNSPLPITVVNNLDVTVTVRVEVSPVNGLPGFTAKSVGRQRIPAKTRVTLHIPTSVERTGRFQVEAVLLTPSGEQIGAPVLLSVHSTALGLIGVIITVVAAVVLALALVVRFVRRFRNRGRPGAPDAAERDPEPVAV